MNLHMPYTQVSVKYSKVTKKIIKKFNSVKNTLYIRET